MRLNRYIIFVVALVLAGCNLHKSLDDVELRAPLDAHDSAGDARDALEDTADSQGEVSPDADAAGCREFCLDLTLDGDGTLILDTGANEVGFSSQGIAIQDDDKLVLVGKAGDANNSDFLVMRLHSDGRFDTGFGDAGRRRLDLGESDEEAKSVVIQPDGKLVVAGISGSHSAVVRLNDDGSLDPEFGAPETPGIRRIAPEGWNRTVINGVDVQSDGRLIVGGQAHSDGGTQWDFQLARLDAAGSLDGGFAEGGTLLVDIFGEDEFGNRPHVLLSGHILFSGSTWAGSERSFDCAVTRNDSAGDAVAAFGEGGYIALDHAGRTDRCPALEVYPDGSILAGGYATNQEDSTEFLLVRMESSGEPDAEFGRDGVRTVHFGQDAEIRSLLLLDETSPRILAAGFTDDGSQEDMALALLNEDGSPDTSFGEGGRLVLDIDEGSNDRLHFAALDSRGRLILFGSSHDGITERLVLMRFTL